MFAPRPDNAATRGRYGWSAPFILLGLVYMLGGFSAVAQQQTPSTADLARQVRQQLTAIRAQLIEAARLTQNHEAIVTRAEQRLADLEAYHAVRSTELRTMQDRLSGLAMALQRLARQPPEAALTAPQPPLEAARAMMLVRFLVPRVRDEASGIRAELTELARLRHDIRGERRRFRTADQALEEQRDRLDALIEQKNVIWRKANNGTLASEQQRGQLADSAVSLRVLFDALQRHGAAQEQATMRLSSLIDAGPERMPPARTGAGPRPRSGGADRPSAQSAVAPPPPIPGSSAAPVPRIRSIRAGKGHLTFPAAGRVIERFGAVDSLGLTTKGITLLTRPRAQVVASYDGKVIYAGPFRRYGRIIIIEHGEGFHTLLVGLGRIDVRTGQGLLAGEPVGVMSGAAPTEQDDPRRLYVEFRQHGAPVDPLAWLSAQRDATNQ